MTALQLTKTSLKHGVWRGIITDMGEDAPKIEVTHKNVVLTDIELTHNESAGHWALSIPIPRDAIADGVHTLIIRDIETDTKIGHITLQADDVAHEDLRAEMDLIRAELDMLKRAFRRHCAEKS